MPRVKSNRTGTPNPSGRFNIRLDADTATFYRKKANERGVSLSEFLRQTLVQGVIAETVTEIEARLKTAALDGTTSSASVPDKLALSILTSEALLSAIVEAKDVSQLYTAQDQAKRRLTEWKGN